MLYTLLKKYMSKHNVSDIREYLSFIKNELQIKLNKLVLSKYALLLLISILVFVTIYYYGSEDKDMLFVYILMFMNVLLIIALSNINNKIHYVEIILNLTINMDDSVPSLDIMLTDNSMLKDRLIYNLNTYLATLSTYINLPHKETFKRFEQHQIHNLI